MRYSLVFLLGVPLWLGCGDSADGSGGGGANAGGHASGGDTSSGGQATGGDSSGGQAQGGQSAGGNDVGGADGTCNSGADCDGGSFCAVLYLPPLCDGMEDTDFSRPCDTDQDCTGANEICTQRLCALPHGGGQPEPHCRAGCETAPDCGVGFDCDAGHHCIAAACGVRPCGANFECNAGSCEPKACTTNADCDDFCVNDSCSALIGSCLPAVP